MWRSEAKSSRGWSPGRRLAPTSAGGMLTSAPVLAGFVAREPVLLALCALLSRYFRSLPATSD
ncbi:MAG TPA: hypothetical protein VNT60_05130 [Deinococcales bacterium]|nr:hypothetical protein [Deinococcales bacterium]